MFRVPSFCLSLAAGLVTEHISTLKIAQCMWSLESGNSTGPGEGQGGQER